MAALTRNPVALEHADDSLKKDKDFMLEASDVRSSCTRVRRRQPQERPRDRDGGGDARSSSTRARQRQLPEGQGYHVGSSDGASSFTPKMCVERQRWRSTYE